MKSTFYKSIGIDVILLSLLILTQGRAYADDATQGPKQVMIEVVMFKVDLSPQNKLGLNWDKKEEMREKDLEVIVGWLEKQGKVKMICSHRGYTDNGNEIRFESYANVPISIARRYPSLPVTQMEKTTEVTQQVLEKSDREPSQEPQQSEKVTVIFREFGNSITLLPEIRDNKIKMTMSLTSEFPLDEGDSHKESSMGKYRIKTVFYAKDGKTVVLDGLLVNEVAKDKDDSGKTALVILITPHIIGE